MRLTTRLSTTKTLKKRYRADVLIEDYAEKLNQKAQKEIEKAKARFGDAFDEAQFVSTNPRVVEYLSKKNEILQRMAKGLDTGDLADVKALIEELEIADPENRFPKLDGSASVQPDVRNQIRCFCGYCYGFVFASGNRSGNLCKLPERTKNGSYENSVWYCSNWESLP